MIRAARGGALGPSGADLDSADIDAVGRRVLVAARRFTDEADVLGLEAEGDDLAGETVLGQLATVFLK